MTLVGDVQGTGHASPVVGQIVTLAGVVTALDTNGRRGLFRTYLYRIGLSSIENRSSRPWRIGRNRGRTVNPQALPQSIAQAIRLDARSHGNPQIIGDPW